MPPKQEPPAPYRGTSYPDWVRATESREDALRPHRQAAVRGMPKGPHISLVMPVYRPEPTFLAEAIASIRKQTYPHWELCIVDDGTGRDDVTALLERQAELAPKSGRIKVKVRKKNGHICRASNDGLSMCTSALTGLVDHDDILHPDALYWVVRAKLAHPAAKLIFTDEDKIDLDRWRSDPHFKHQLDRHIILAQNFISHFGVYDTQMLRDIGGFRVGFEGSQDHDLALRSLERLEDDEIVHIPRVLYHWRKWEGSTASHSLQKSYAHQAGVSAVNDHLDRTGLPMRARALRVPGCIHHGPSLPVQDGSVQVIMRGNPSSREACLQGADLIAQGGAAVREVCTDMDADFFPLFVSALGETCGAAAPACRHLRPAGARAPQPDGLAEHGAPTTARVFVDLGLAPRALMPWFHADDVPEQNTTWVTEVVGRLRGRGVGIVGGSVLDTRGDIEQAGVAFGPGNLCQLKYTGERAECPGYTGRSAIVQEVSAVGPSYMAVGADIWRDLGGFLPHLSAHMAALDFCLRAQARGRKTVFTPFSPLQRTHAVTPPAQLSRHELLFLLQKHARRVRADRYMSPNMQYHRGHIIISPPTDVARYPRWARE